MGDLGKIVNAVAFFSWLPPLPASWSDPRPIRPRNAPATCRSIRLRRAGVRSTFGFPGAGRRAWRERGPAGTAAGPWEEGALCERGVDDGERPAALDVVHARQAQHAAQLLG